MLRSLAAAPRTHAYPQHPPWLAFGSSKGKLRTASSIAAMPLSTRWLQGGDQCWQTGVARARQPMLRQRDSGTSAHAEHAGAARHGAGSARLGPVGASLCRPHSATARSARALSAGTQDGPAWLRAAALAPEESRLPRLQLAPQLAAAGVEAHLVPDLKPLLQAKGAPLRAPAAPPVPARLGELWRDGMACAAVPAHWRSARPACCSGAVPCWTCSPPAPHCHKPPGSIACAPEPLLVALLLKLLLEVQG